MSLHLIVVICTIVIVAAIIVAVILVKKPSVKVRTELQYDTISELKDKLQFQTVLFNSTDTQRQELIKQVNTIYGISTADDSVLINGAIAANNSKIKAVSSKLKSML